MVIRKWKPDSLRFVHFGRIERIYLLYQARVFHSQLRGNPGSFESFAKMRCALVVGREQCALVGRERVNLRKCWSPPFSLISSAHAQSSHSHLDKQLFPKS